MVRGSGVRRTQGAASSRHPQEHSPHSLPQLPPPLPLSSSSASSSPTSNNKTQFQRKYQQKQKQNTSASDSREYAPLPLSPDYDAVYAFPRSSEHEHQEADGLLGGFEFESEFDPYRDYDYDAPAPPTKLESNMPTIPTEDNTNAEQTVTALSATPRPRPPRAYSPYSAFEGKSPAPAATTNANVKPKSPIAERFSGASFASSTTTTTTASFSSTMHSHSHSASGTGTGMTTTGYATSTSTAAASPPPVPSKIDERSSSMSESKGARRRSTLQFEIGGTPVGVGVGVGAGNGHGHGARPGSKGSDESTLSSSEASSGNNTSDASNAAVNANEPAVAHNDNDNNNASAQLAQTAPAVGTGNGNTTTTIAADDTESTTSDLVPPRPRFLREHAHAANNGSSSDRGSWSSQDSALYASSDAAGTGTGTGTGTDTNEDSDAAVAPAPVRKVAASPRKAAAAGAGARYRSAYPPSAASRRWSGSTGTGAGGPSAGLTAGGRRASFDRSGVPQTQPSNHAHAHVHGAAAVAEDSTPAVGYSAGMGYGQGYSYIYGERAPSPVPVQATVPNPHLRSGSPPVGVVGGTDGMGMPLSPLSPLSSPNGQGYGHAGNGGNGVYAAVPTTPGTPGSGSAGFPPPGGVSVRQRTATGGSTANANANAAPAPPSAFRGPGARGSMSLDGYASVGAGAEGYYDAPASGSGPESSNGHASVSVASSQGYGYQAYQGQGQGYQGYPPQPAVPQPQAQPQQPRPHNAFMAQSAIARTGANGSVVDLVPYAARINGTGASRRGSMDGSTFAPPNPPFAHGAIPSTPGTPPGRSASLQDLAALRASGSSPRPGTVGGIALREPFLSPASRRASSVWAPPTPALYTLHQGQGLGQGAVNYGPNGEVVPVLEQGSGYGLGVGGGGNGSAAMLPLPPHKEPMASSALQRKISVSEKPWIRQRDRWERVSWWSTFLLMWVGVAAGAVVCFFGFTNVQKITHPLCVVLDDDFSSFNTDVWQRDVELGGFGNGEFQMTTASDENLYIKNGELYIMPTFTSDEIGAQAVLNGHTYNLTGCTSTNASACTATSNAQAGSVINPVKSARIFTSSNEAIAFGKVEVVAKLPTGDWLWPAIWMLPVDDETYGEWPASGEIDIMEARGNAPSYPAQGNNFVRSTLTWGPIDALIARAFGWQSVKRGSYADGFHTYTLEWDSTFMRFSVDSQLHAMLDLSLKKSSQSFWDRGHFPQVAQNGSTEVVVQNPYAGRDNAAPFDQPFYLILDLAVGGTSGWFPDGVGGKMWFDGSASAMADFANAQATWSASWPGSDDERAFRVDSVKMWKMC